MPSKVVSHLRENASADQLGLTRWLGPQVRCSCHSSSTWVAGRCTWKRRPERNATTDPFWYVEELQPIQYNIEIVEKKQKQGIRSRSNDQHRPCLSLPWHSVKRGAWLDGSSFTWVRSPRPLWGHNVWFHLIVFDLNETGKQKQIVWSKKQLRSDRSYVPYHNRRSNQPIKHLRYHLSTLGVGDGVQTCASAEHKTSTERAFTFFFARPGIGHWEGQNVAGSLSAKFKVSIENLVSIDKLRYHFMDEFIKLPGGLVSSSDSILILSRSSNQPASGCANHKLGDLWKSRSWRPYDGHKLGGIVADLRLSMNCVPLSALKICGFLPILAKKSWRAALATGSVISTWL